MLRYLRALQPLVGLGQAVVASASGWVVALRDNAVLTWQYCHNLVPSNRILLLPSCVCVSVASCASFCSNSRAL